MLCLRFNAVFKPRNPNVQEEYGGKKKCSPRILALQLFSFSLLFLYTFVLPLLNYLYLHHIRNICYRTNQVFRTTRSCCTDVTQNSIRSVTVWPQSIRHSSQLAQVTHPSEIILSCSSYHLSVTSRQKKRLLIKNVSLCVLPHEGSFCR